MIALYILGSIYLLWFFYLAVMNLARARDNGTLTRTALYLGSPIFIIGYALDVLVNIFIMTILFLELPKEWTVTGRVKRHIYHGSGWRESLASWFCYNLLNAFDPDGKHC